MEKIENDLVRQAVRSRYGRVAEAGSAGCGCGSSCCSPGDESKILSGRVGYSSDEMNTVPAEANMGLGCGNPQAIAALKPGETVLDLGSGGGFDCFLAARQVGDAGRVFGVDMTPEMVSKARENARKGGFPNVEFRLGEIEYLPVGDNTVDVIISNCVINLSPDKNQVFADAYRVLKPGGRLAVSDVVAIADMPEEVRGNMALFTGCMAGASLVQDIQAMLESNGFTDIQVALKEESRHFIKEWAPGSGVEEYLRSAAIEARKPL